MKVSEITNINLTEYVRTDETEDLSMFFSAAKAYVRSYTGMDDTEIDTHEDITPVVFILVSDMYDNRSYTVQNDKVNVVAKTILDMYCKNLL
jgi:hypothetical protein